MTDQPDDDELPHGVRSRFSTVLLCILALAICFATIAVLFLPLFSPNLGRSDPSARPAFTPKAPEQKPDLTVHYDTLPFLLPPGVRAGAKQTVAFRCPIPGKSDANAFGSGFLLRDGIAVTAAHVIASNASGQPLYVYCDGKRVDGTVLAYDETRDVAVVKADGCSASPLPLETRKLRIDDELHASGFVFGEDDDDMPAAKRFYAMTSPIPQAVLRPEKVEHSGPEGVILAQRIRKARKLGIPRYQALSGAAIPGQSGSPVFTESGAIVGMIVIRDAVHNRTYIVPAISIAQTLHDAGLD